MLIYIYGENMGNVMLSIDEDTEKLLRRMAHKRYGGKKGALSKVASEAIRRYNDDSEEKQREEFFAMLRKGQDLGGYKMYKNRSELYD